MLSAVHYPRSELSGIEAENITVTAKRLPTIPPSDSRQSIEYAPLPPTPLPASSHPPNSDLQLLAISTHITELSYSISDIQTRIFEIQELRHKSQSSNDLSASTSVIDQSLMALDERLESVSNGVKAVAASMQPLLVSSTTNGATRDSTADDEKALLVRKHAAFVVDWESVQEESEVLREELKEDKWLTVFRTVTEQADGMMTSLEKAVNRCQVSFFVRFCKSAEFDAAVVHRLSLAVHLSHFGRCLSIGTRSYHRVFHLMIFILRSTSRSA